MSGCLWYTVYGCSIFWGLVAFLVGCMCVRVSENEGMAGVSESDRLVIINLIVSVEWQRYIIFEIEVHGLPKVLLLIWE